MKDIDINQDNFSKAASVIARAGMVPFAITDTLVEIVKYYLNEKDAAFISNNFNQGTSLSHKQLKEKSGLSNDEIATITDRLAKKGIIFNQPNSRGVAVYKVLPLIVVGTFEYTFMNELTDDMDLTRHKKIAKLYEKLLEELRDNIQSKYDQLLPVYKVQPPVDRTIPVFEKEDGKPIIINEAIAAEEQVIPARTVKDIINKFDEIAVGHCFCRNYNRMLEKPCAYDSPSEVCFTFGKSARHTIAQGFSRPIDRDEALRILTQAEKAGLVHKAFHNGSNIEKEENSICNCCKDYCDTFMLWRNGAAPMINATNYLSIIDYKACTGCGDCVERCPVDAIELDGSGKAIREESYCIGCAVCARFCTAGAITLQEGMRKVCVPPPRLR